MRFVLLFGVYLNSTLTVESSKGELIYLIKFSHFMTFAIPFIIIPLYRSVGRIPTMCGFISESGKIDNAL